MTKNARYKGFDGLRGISVLLVIVSHLGLWGNLQPDIADRVIPVLAAPAGVNLFFVISGFLITTLLIKEQSDFGSISIRLFLIRRVLRLVPAFLIFIVVVGVFMSWGLIQPSGLALLLSAFYLYNFVPHGSLYISELAHTWSLAIEEHFYLLWSWGVAKLRTGTLIKSSILAVLVCMISAVFVGGTRQRWTIPGAAPIMIGCLISIYHFVVLPQRVTRWNPSDTDIAVAAIILWTLPLFVPPPALKLIHIPHLCGLGLSVYWVYRNSESLLVRLLELKPLAYLGMISYGLYLWQGLFVTNGPDGKLWIQQFPQNIFLTLLVAMLSFHLVEKHFLQFKKKFVLHVPANRGTQLVRE